MKTSIAFDNVPPKLLKTASDIILKPLSNLINETMVKCLHFPNTEKIACITPAFKKDDRHKKENYRPISVLNAFLKLFERFLLDQMVPYLENILSVFISAFRKHYSCQHVLLRMIEMWRRCLDDNKMVGTILMDLSKALDCLPHDLLIAELDAYGFDKEALRLQLKIFIILQTTILLLKLERLFRS